MVYLINKSVVYTEKDNSLAWINRSDEAVSLSLPVAKLLQTLIIHPGMTLSKEYLLTEVLEKNALAPSMNNLNNYISLLRKSLREYELAEFLMTVPKVGIMFNTLDIEVICDDSQQSSVQNSVMELPPPPPQTQGIKYKNSLYFVAIGTLVVLILFYNFILSIDFPYREIFRDTNITNCEFYYIDDDAINDGFQEKYHYLCQNNVDLYYFSRKIIIPKIATREESIVISCKKEGKRCSTHVFINNQ
ncbi:winged helix-turn-helix domain-containing protein [Lonsdalea quercina]|uniref:winged helix-turn-helix domain-containing protein n=1 Tax=Lonsdalea quercina TaxID=71657 RepID=UPI003975042E